MVRQYEQSSVGAASSSWQAPPEIVDKDYLDSLRKVGQAAGQDLLGELIGLFLEDATEHLAAIHEGLGRGDTKMLEEAAHSLKGTAGTIGATRLRSLCAAIEDQARDGSFSIAARLSILVPDEVDKAQQRVRDELALETATGSDSGSVRES